MTIEYRVPERLPLPSLATRVVSGGFATQLTIAGGGVVADKFQGEYSLSVVAFDASVVLDANNREIGLSFGPGQNGVGSGTSSIRIDELTGDISRLAGCSVICRSVFQVSATFTPTMNASVSVIRDGVVIGLTSGTATITTFDLIRNERIGNFLYRDLKFVLTGTEQVIRPYLFASGANAVGSESVRYLWHSIELSDVIDTNSSPQQQALSQAMQRMKSVAVEDVAPYGFANTFQRAYTLAISPFDSTAIVDSDGNRIGLSFAAGQNGDSLAAISIRERTGDISRLAGTTVALRALYEVSPTFTPTISPAVTVVRAGVVVPLSAGSTPTTTQYQVLRNERLGNLVYRDEAFLLTGTEEELRAVVVVGGSAAVGTETLTYKQHSFQLLTGVDGSATRSEQALGQAFQRMESIAVGVAVGLASSTIPYAQETVLAADGSGDTTDFRTAYHGLLAGTVAEPHAVRIEPGTYQHDAAVVGDTSYIIPDHLDLVGRLAARTSIENQQPNTALPADTATNEPIRMWENNNVRDLTVVGKNVRYAFHNDPGNARPEKVQNFTRVRAIHYGNEGAYNYQVGLGGGGNPGGVWMLDRPFGYGSDSGDVVNFSQGYMQGHQRGFGQHDVADTSDPFETRIENSEIALTWTTDELTYAYWLASTGSGQPNGLQFIGVSTTGDLDMKFSGWLSNDPKNQPADPSFTLQVRGYCHAPMVCKITATQQRALKIASANTGSTSSVSLTGSTPALIDALFGQVFTQAGPGGGLPAYVWGWNNVKEMSVGPTSSDQITALGKRLGNRTTTPWTLAVSFNGAAAINKVFNVDYTALTNATILGQINTAFGASGTASEFDILGRQRPIFMDEIRRLMNTSATAIPIWSWCAYNSSVNKVRLMTSADAQTLSAGSAYSNDIYPASLGIVKHHGYYGIADIIVNGAPTLVFGDLLEIDAANPGQFLKNNASSRAILRCVRTDTFARVTRSIAT